MIHFRYSENGCCCHRSWHKLIRPRCTSIVFIAREQQSRVIRRAAAPRIHFTSEKCGSGMTVCSLFSFSQSVFGQVVDGGSSGGGGIRVPCSRVGAQALLGLCISIVPHFPLLLLLSILTLVWCVVRVSHHHNHIFSPRYTFFLPDLNGYFRSPSPSFCMSVEDSCCTAATGPLLAHSFSVTAVNSQSDGTFSPVCFEISFSLSTFRTTVSK